MIKKTILLFLCLLLPAIGYTQATESEKIFRTKPKPIDLSVPIPYQPAVSFDHGSQVKGIAQNWLALITSLYEEKDLSFKKIEKKLKIELKQDPREIPEYSYWQKLDKEWAYSVYTSSYPEKARVIVMALRHIGGPVLEVPADFCLDLGYFQNELNKQGYRHLSSFNVGGGSIQFMNKNGRVHLDLNFEGEKHGDKWRDCIVSIDLNLSNIATLPKAFGENIE